VAATLNFASQAQRKRFRDGCSERAIRTSEILQSG